MKKMSFKNINNLLSRDEMKKIMAGSSPGDSCNVGAQCWNWYRATFGICYPAGTSCQCVANGAGVYSGDCNPWV